MLTSLFREAYPRHTAKHVARAADAPVATAKAWVAGRFTPSATTLLKMAAACGRLADALERHINASRDPAMASPGAASRREMADGNGAAQGQAQGEAVTR